jgi:hypothetical protein
MKIDKDWVIGPLSAPKVGDRYRWLGSTGDLWEENHVYTIVDDYFPYVTITSENGNTLTFININPVLWERITDTSDVEDTQTETTAPVQPPPSVLPGSFDEFTEALRLRIGGDTANYRPDPGPVITEKFYRDDQGYLVCEPTIVEELRERREG